jgi:hypothetical protein
MWRSRHYRDLLHASDYVTHQVVRGSPHAHAFASKGNVSRTRICRSPGTTSCRRQRRTNELYDRHAQGRLKAHGFEAQDSLKIVKTTWEKLCYSLVVLSAQESPT